MMAFMMPTTPATDLASLSATLPQMLLVLLIYACMTVCGNAALVVAASRRYLQAPVESGNPTRRCCAACWAFSGCSRCSSS